jgi:hypothetical protein
LPQSCRRRSMVYVLQPGSLRAETMGMVYRGSGTLCKLVWLQRLDSAWLKECA